MISLIGGVIAQIRGADRCLILADAGSETYRTTPIPWAEFETAWVQRVQTLAQLYQPDYYIVVKEPRWYGPMISDATTNPLVSSPSAWLALTQQLIAAVQAVSPNTKIGVSVDAGSLDDPQYEAMYDGYIQGASLLSGLSFIGFDVYQSSDQTATQAYLTQNGSGGKDVWVSETWSSPTPGTAAHALSDATWMSQAYQFATGINAKFLTPFYTDLFASYSWDTNPTDIINNYAMRQPVFYAYQSLVLQYGTPTTGVPEFASSTVGVAALSVAAVALIARRKLATVS